jgi:hypothetical protein
MDLKNFENEIAKTGFQLEHRIASMLRSHGWTVISNRYYVDDQEESIREIDLVAYRARRIHHFNVVTTLIVSCKKNQQNVWALLSRKVDLSDPNSDWRPVHCWTNDKALHFMVSQGGWPQQYHSRAQELGVSLALDAPRVDVFAFQEMKRESGTPQNDKAIFASITSLMKAQSYELEALPRRRKNPCVYRFNLLSVVDTDLVRLDFEGEACRAQTVTDEHYIARYIVKKKDTVARIHFVQAEEFERVLEDYDRLHLANCTIYPELYDDFFTDLLADESRQQVFIDEFNEAVDLRLHLRLLVHAHLDVKVEGLWLYWDKRKDLLSVMVKASEEIINFLNADDGAKETVRKALLRIYRYEGLFNFMEEDLPF